MSWEIIAGLVGFIVALIAIVTPIVKLNVNIGRLNTTIELFREDTEKKHDSLDQRVSRHGEQIDELEKTAVQHDVRISAIEHKKGK